MTNEDIEALLLELRTKLRAISDPSRALSADPAIGALFQRALAWFQARDPHQVLLTSLIAGNQTTMGSVAGPVLSGTFSGPVTTGVTVEQIAEIIKQLSSIAPYVQQSPTFAAAKRLEELLAQVSPAPAALRRAFRIVMPAGERYDEQRSIGQLLRAVDDPIARGGRRLLEFAIVLKQDRDTTAKLRSALDLWLKEAIIAQQLSPADLEQLSADLHLLEQKHLPRSLQVAIIQAGSATEYRLRIWEWIDGSAYQRYTTETASEGDLAAVQARFSAVYDAILPDEGIPIEFFLPRTLFTEPVQTWAAGCSDYDPITAVATPAPPIWERHPIVIRSHDRAFLQPAKDPRANKRIQELLTRWHRKWCRASRQAHEPCRFAEQQICEYGVCGEVGQFYMPQQSDAYTDLQTELLHPQIVAFAETHAPPPDTAHQIFAHVLNGGLPLGLWPDRAVSRSAALYPDFITIARSASDELSASRTFALGRLLRDKRLAGEKAALCRRIVLLFDDPMRVPAQKEHTQPDS